MKKLLSLFVMFGFLLVVSCEGPVETITSDDGTYMPSPKKGDYPTISGGEIYYSTSHYYSGEVIPTGYNDFGYNFNSHLFKGSYVNVYLGGLGFPPYTGNDEEYLADNPNAANHWSWQYRASTISMKWNDAWLANSDRNEDGKLDRYYGHNSYVGSGAVEIYKVSGLDADGKKYNYMCKIIAVPTAATLTDGIWYDADNNEIGENIWGQFAITQVVYTNNYPWADSEVEFHTKPGLGKYK
ncbi:MAG: hypothetical protein KAH48_11195 [Chlorobi bacterium]|nr:hypothetical protein [Chlorobiota bacterium]